MARDWKTTYAAAAAAATHTAPFPQPAIAGRRLVAFAVAPASVDPSAPWSEIAEAPDPLLGDLSASTLVAVGGETSATWVREPSTGTAPRTLAGWVESRDDLGELHGAPATYGNPTGIADIQLAPIVTTVDGCRIYVAVCTVNDASGWTPTFTGPVALEDVVTGPALGAETVRLAVASGVVAAGSHNITISGVPISPAMVVAFAVAPATATPPPAAETAVEDENRKTGVDKAVWDVAGGGDPTIQGYSPADRVVRGTGVEVKVHSPASAWTARVYRLGWYGGRGAREVGTFAGPQTTQPGGTTDPTTGMVSCAGWSVNGTWQVPADATPGAYIITVARTDLPAAKSHIGPFVVVDPNRKAKIAVKLSDSTWQAYNYFGADPADPFNGRNLYGQGTAAGFTFDNAQRCRAVSYDRPLVTRRSLPQTHFFNAEYPLLRWLERLGYDVDYLTCAQVDADPSLLLGRDVVISSGHDEYWSQGMWDAYTAARDDAGDPSHLVFLSGNEAFWRIRWAAGRRSYSCWKDSLDGALNSTGVYSGTWQDIRSFNPQRRPAALLNGQRFRLNAFGSLPMAATAAHAASPLWRNTPVAALTGAATWTSPPGIVGFEADEPADMNPAEKPAGLIRLSQVTHQIAGQLADDNGATYNGSGSYTHAVTAYRSPATGAAVFAAGTVQFAWGLDDTHDRHPGGTLVSAPLQQALSNMLADLGAVPPAYPFPSGLVMPAPVALSAYGLPNPAGDTTAPTVPTGLAGTPAQTSVALTWTAAADDVAVTGYRIYRGGAQVAQVGPVTAYTVAGLTGGTSYEWRVSALDAAGNESAQSAPLVLATIAPPITLDPAEPVGMVRLLITDTDEAFPLFTDEQLGALLAMEGGNVKRGAAAALETIATSETLVAKKISTQDLSVDGPAVATSLMGRAKVLREQADTEAGVVADPDGYGFDYVDFPTAGTHPGVGWSSWS